MEGHQPMVSHCGNFVIGFNGEVYNYDNLRKQLIREGVKFKSNSDTDNDSSLQLGLRLARGPQDQDLGH